MPSIASIVTSPNKGCHYDPKGPGAWLGWPGGTMYHCPICFVILIAGLSHPSRKLTRILLELQEVGLWIKVQLRNKFPKRPNLESWLREDGN